MKDRIRYSLMAAVTIGSLALHGCGQNRTAETPPPPPYGVKRGDGYETTRYSAYQFGLHARPTENSSALSNADKGLIEIAQNCTISSKPTVVASESEVTIFVETNSCNSFIIALNNPPRRPSS